MSEFDKDLKDSNAEWLRELEIKEIKKAFDNKGYFFKDYIWVDKDKELSKRLQRSGVDLIVGDSKEFFIEIQVNKKHPNLFAFEILHDFYHKRFDTKDLSKFYKFESSFHFWFYLNEEKKRIDTTLFLDSRKLQNFYKELLEDSGVNVYLPESYLKLTPGNKIKHRSWGKPLEIHPNSLTYRYGKIRNQSCYVWVIPWNHLKDCFVTEIGFKQRRLMEF